MHFQAFGFSGRLLFFSCWRSEFIPVFGSCLQPPVQSANFQSSFFWLSLPTSRLCACWLPLGRAHVSFTHLSVIAWERPGQLDWEHWLSHFLSLKRPGSWGSLGVTWVTRPDWQARSGWWRKGMVQDKPREFSGCPLLFPRMSGDVSSQVLHVLASYLWPASRICHTLHRGLLPWQNEFPRSPGQGAQQQLAPGRLDEGAQVLLQGGLGYCWWRMAEYATPKYATLG